MTVKTYECSWPSCGCDPEGVESPVCRAEHATELSAGSEPMPEKRGWNELTLKNYPFLKDVPCPSDSDTPRTDEAELSFLDIQNGHGTSPYVSAEIARQFERELNEQRQIAQKYEDRYFNLLGMFQKLLERNITFDCNNAVLHFESHDQAINHIAEARRYGR